MAVLHGRGERKNTFHHDTGYGEYYVAPTGISYSDPRIREYFAARGATIENSAAAPWLQDEAQQVLDLAGKSAVTLVEGDLGAGKSTVLFGARTLLRQNRRPYVVVNGHFLNRGPEIASAVSKANSRGQAVVYDSLDYLFLKNGKDRNAKLARPVVMDALRGHLADGGTLIGTSHTKPWLDRYSNPTLQDEFNTFTGEAGASFYRVHGYLADDDSLARVCANVGDAEYGSLYPAYANQSAQPTARTYRVAKLLGKQVGGASGLLGMSNLEFDAMVQEIDGVTRAKMNVGPEYSLLPPHVVASQSAIQ